MVLHEESKGLPHKKIKNEANDSFFLDQEMLKCTICFMMVSEPVMCPSCSTLACKKCLNEWLSTKTSCPNCRIGL